MPVDAQKLQWGRRLSTTETFAYANTAGDAPLLQWGRRLSTTETGSDSYPDGGTQLLQWGRRLSTTETTMSVIDVTKMWSSFNEAVVFQRRKPDTMGTVRTLDLTTLQWGRRLSTTETLHSSFFFRVLLLLLQWGRRLSTTETCPVGSLIKQQARLQWGRRLSTTETRFSGRK